MNVRTCFLFIVLAVIMTLSMAQFDNILAMNFFQRRCQPTVPGTQAGRTALARTRSNHLRMMMYGFDFPDPPYSPDVSDSVRMWAMTQGGCRCYSVWDSDTMLYRRFMNIQMYESPDCMTGYNCGCRGPPPPKQSTGRKPVIGRRV